MCFSMEVPSGILCLALHCILFDFMCYLSRHPAIFPDTPHKPGGYCWEPIVVCTASDQGLGVLGGFVDLRSVRGTVSLPSIHAF